jgi:hypothetical protein
VVLSLLQTTNDPFLFDVAAVFSESEIAFGELVHVPSFSAKVHLFFPQTESRIQGAPAAGPK